ncbi:hypothetical protein Zmor_019384 [Zophobas morio]|uniref:Gustatory receptor n=1 Tax=Zophobas morio TaxID=2755281 RepID=A0AA38M8G7_9CUCU|nr:hypothetical protein Zmor_019384 [Zophobas morio]
MSFKLLRLLLRIGKLLALTPSYSEINFPSRNKSGKKYGLLMVAFLTFAQAISIVYRLPIYVKMSPMRLTTEFFVDCTLYLISISTIVVFQSKKDLLKTLVDDLKTVKNFGNVKDNRYGHFISVNIFFWCYQLHTTYVGLGALGLEFLKQYAIEYILLYNELIVNFIFFILLKMLLSRYKTLTTRLQNRLDLLEETEVPNNFTNPYEIKKDFCRLKEAVDVINAIFGWPFLFTTAYASFQTLVYLQGIIVYKKMTFNATLYLFVVIFWQYTCVLVNIFLCDDVTKEGRKCLDKSYTFAKYVFVETKSKQMQMFLVTLRDNLPQFSAARFFRINRTTICSFFKVILTFVIVMVQFQVAK